MTPPVPRPSAAVTDGRAVDAVRSEAPASGGERGRVLAIDRGKGIGIFLVVLGHLYLAAEAPDWYRPLKVMIYQFHMPFFMYLSGWIFFHVGAHETFVRSEDKGAYGTYVIRRAQRLLVPFLIFGSLVILGKELAARFTHVDDAPMTLGAALASFVVHTNAGPAMSLWYIFCLFVYVILVPIVWKLAKGRFRLVLLAAVALALIPIADVLFADRVFGFLPFFIAGGALRLTWESGTSDLFRRGFPYFAALFLVVVPLSLLVPPSRASIALLGLLSLPVLHQLALELEGTAGRFFLWLGGHSFAIYLMNTIFIGVAKAVSQRTGFGTLADRCPQALIMMSAGLFLPILVKQLILRHWRWSYQLVS